MLPNYYLSVKFVCPGWRIPHLTLISSVEMSTEMQLYPRGKVKCFKPAMQFFHLPKSGSKFAPNLLLLRENLPRSYQLTSNKSKVLRA